MKKNYIIGLIILSLLISQQLFPQKENTKNPLRGEQQIELSEGYSFVSSRIIADNPDIKDILQSNLVNLEFVRNSQGFMLQKIGPVWVNNIGDWVNTEGYLFKMSATDELTIMGDVIDPQTPVALSTGYQIVGYLPDEALNTEDIFQDLLENLVFVRNTAGFMFQKIGPVWVNNIGDMQPGEGYLVKMNADDILIYPGSSSFNCGDPFTDPRDGQTYNTVQIGDQCWMAENLNIGTMINGTVEMTENGVIEKYCYDNDPANCETYGGLYQWNEMMEYSTTPGVQGICPGGWHLPTDDEWITLTDFLSGAAGGKMKETGTTYWQSPNAGATNESGFTALPGGNRDNDGNFYSLTSHAFFWSSSEHLSSYARYRYLTYLSDFVFSNLSYKSFGFRVRCVQDDFTPTNQPPEQPSSPNPEDGVESQSIEVDLSWSCTDPENDPLTYDIYFGTVSTPPQIATGQTETYYYSGTLENNTEYFWKIIAHDNQGNTTDGPVWSFTTMAEPDCDDGIPCTIDYYDYDLGECVHEPNDNICDDGVFCNGQEICDPTLGCVSGTPTVIDDGIECTIDLCDESLNVVLHIPDDSACDDGDPETTDICDPESGCLHIPVSSCGDPFTDPRDGQTYETVQIGNQCWMAENLNIGTRIDGSSNQTNDNSIEKYCYDNLESNCDTYGGLYQWDEVMQYSTNEGVQGICPIGWHVPTDAEWAVLVNELGGVSIAGGKLKEIGTAHWISPNTGATNESGFTGLPGGYRYNNVGNYDAMGLYGFFWTSSYFMIPTLPYRWHLYALNSQATQGYENPEQGTSLRCLSD